MAEPKTDSGGKAGQVPGGTDVATKSDTVQPPLIPESAVDAASQRMFMVSLFVLVQAWKLYDLYVLRHEDLRQQIYKDQMYNLVSPEWIFLFKFLFLDALVVWLTSIFHIPKLTFRPIVSLLWLAALYAIDFSMALDISGQVTAATAVPSLRKWLFPSKELGILENYVDTDQLEDQSDHFKGKMTIRYSPDSMIQLNPYEQNFCLDMIHGKPLQVPVAFESTSGLDTLQVSYHDLNNNLRLINYTKRDLKSMTVKDSHTIPGYDPAIDTYHLVRIPVALPGSYSIKVATDGKHKSIRSERGTVIVPMCPEASFSPVEYSDRCVGDEVGNLTINVLGVPPFTLYYEEDINGELSHVPKSVIIPDEEDFQSPLLSRELYMGHSDSKQIQYRPENLKDLSWAQTRNIAVPVGNRQIHDSGKYTYVIEKVIDGFGNTVKYKLDPKNSDTFLSLDAHPMPLLSLVDPQPNRPILTGNDKYLEVKLSQVPCVDCEKPYTVVFKYLPEESEEDPEIFTKTFNFNSPAQIKVEKPGLYMIETASSQYCGCRLGSSSLSVREAKKPSVHVDMEPVVDQCIGTTGFKFNFEFVGSAPFEVGYSISRLDPKDSSKVVSTEKIGSLRSSSTVLEYEFNPTSEGSFAIEFVSLSDKFYKNQVRFNKHEYRYITYFKQRPKAFFDKRSRVQRLSACNAGVAEAELNLDGKAPFTVTYNLISPDYTVKTYTLDNIEESKTKIVTPPLMKGGVWVLSLKDVHDSSSCSVDFKGQEVHISVRNDVPHLRFAAATDYSLVQGNRLRIPLKAESADPIDLTYNFRSFDGPDQLKKARLDPTEGLPVYEEGEYSLVSFEQAGCPGKVSDKTAVSVRYLGKPDIRLLGKSKMTEQNGVFIVGSICQETEGSLNFKVSGVAPFVVKYEVKHNDGHVEEKTQQLTGHNFGLQLKTAGAGDYTYSIVGIYDSVYPQSILGSLDGYHFDPIVVKNHVNALPVAGIVNRATKIQSCISSLDDPSKLTPLKLSLRGQLPIDVDLLITKDQESTGEIIQLKQLSSKEVNVKAIYEKMGLGTYTVSVASVKDANGCTNQGTENQKLTITINDVPKIRHLVEQSSVISEHAQKQLESAEDGFSYYCVGDYITYMLSGTPPFNVQYEFNGRKQGVKLEKNYFERRAPSPGELKILSVSDSSSKNCQVEFTSTNKRPDLSARIFDLPSVELVSPSIDQDIYEGEQAEILFKFTGTPPFKLTYVRTDLSGGGKVVETEVVDKIYGHEYKVAANLEGIYEAIEIQDAYCIARNHHI